MVVVVVWIVVSRLRMLLVARTRTFSSIPVKWLWSFQYLPFGGYYYYHHHHSLLLMIHSVDVVLIWCAGTEIKVVATVG